MPPAPRPRRSRATRARRAAGRRAADADASPSRLDTTDGWLLVTHRFCRGCTTDSLGATCVPALDRLVRGQDEDLPRHRGPQRGVLPAKCLIDGGWPATVGQRRVALPSPRWRPRRCPEWKLRHDETARFSAASLFIEIHEKWTGNRRVALIGCQCSRAPLSRWSTSPEREAASPGVQPHKPIGKQDDDND
jgi:hypothetical protein